MMTIGQLKKRIYGLPDGLAIVVRIPAGDELNGNCFDLGSVSVETDHVTDEDFAGFDCNQDGDLSATGFLPSKRP
jgi:hypothetical protein